MEIRTTEICDPMPPYHVCEYKDIPPTLKETFSDRIYPCVGCKEKWSTQIGMTGVQGMFRERGDYIYCFDSCYKYRCYHKWWNELREWRRNRIFNNQ